ncbi:MAG: hypothetical protein A2Y17_02405 [Clostridiales bacterium GWF2_38_85]|nr:MAG: hypothetical protein A2Y17_02405 [Clostridiales bacterium GWF2_38_85]
MNLLKVSSSPHIRQRDTTRSIMTDVVIALCPALFWSIYVFGWRSLTLTILAVGSAVGFEYLFQYITKRTITAGDMSAVVTGMLIAFNMPVTAPLWLPVIGSAFAIIIVKQLFGGIGKNIVNPALAARVFLLSWSNIMMAFVQPMTSISPISVTVSSETIDVISTATPLATLKTGMLDQSLLLEKFYGFIPGCIGEISVLMLLLGFIYLLIRKVITPHITMSFILTLAGFTFLYGYLTGNASPFEYMLHHLLSGGLFLGAIFMATDYTTSPFSPSGKIIFGIGCGLLTALIRIFGGYPEGVSFAILIMNSFIWYLDKWTRPRVFGGNPEKAEKKG